MKVAAACEPLVALLHKRILTGDVISLDETPVQVLREEGRKATDKSYMWLLYGGPPKKPAVLYKYAPSRAQRELALLWERYRCRGFVDTIYSDSVGKAE